MDNLFFQLSYTRCNIVFKKHQNTPVKNFSTILDKENHLVTQHEKTMDSTFDEKKRFFLNKFNYIPSFKDNLLPMYYPKFDAAKFIRLRIGERLEKTMYPTDTDKIDSYLKYDSFHILFREKKEKNKNKISQQVFHQIIDTLLDILHNKNTKVININAYFWYFPCMIDLIILMSQYFDACFFAPHLSPNFTTLSHHITFVECNNLEQLAHHLQTIQQMNLTLTDGFLDLKEAERSIYTTPIEKYFDDYYAIKSKYYKLYEENYTWNNFIKISEQWNNDIVSRLMSSNYMLQTIGENKLSHLLQTRVLRTPDGKTRLHSSINSKEGKLLTYFVKKYKVRNALEIGMAYGISAMFILLSMLSNSKSKNIHLTSIDPYQSTQWKNLGRKNLENIGLLGHHTLHEDKSEIILPLLYKLQHKYDLIFIDGWHTFDNTLIDVYYAIRLVSVGGLIIIDDIRHQGVGKLVKYVDVNYRHLERVNYDIHTMAVYRKLKDDDRSWNFHKHF